MIDQILTTVITLLVFLAGYFIGKKEIPPIESPKKWFTKVKDKVIKPELGAVERPSALDIEKQNNPLIRGEEEAMTETFRHLIPKS